MKTTTTTSALKTKNTVAEYYDHNARLAIIEFNKAYNDYSLKIYKKSRLIHLSLYEDFESAERAVIDIGDGDFDFCIKKA